MLSSTTSYILPSSTIDSTPIPYPIISLVPSCIEHMCCDHKHPFLTLYALDMLSSCRKDVFMTFDLEKEVVGWLVKEKEGQDVMHFSMLPPHTSVHFVKLRDGTLKNHALFIHCSIFRGMFLFYFI